MAQYLVSNGGFYGQRPVRDVEEYCSVAIND